jgi:hypothetical protein
MRACCERMMIALTMTTVEATRSYAADLWDIKNILSYTRWHVIDFHPNLFWAHLFPIKKGLWNNEHSTSIYHSCWNQWHQLKIIALALKDLLELLVWKFLWSKYFCMRIEVQVCFLFTILIRRIVFVYKNMKINLKCFYLELNKL